MNRTRPWIAQLLLVVTVMLPGCMHHEIAFEDLSYDINAAKHDARMVVVIDEDNLRKIVPVRYFFTGIAQSWDVQPGEMLKQVSDAELPQMFTRYESMSTYIERKPVDPPLILKLAVPVYKFDNFHAEITVQATATVGDKVLFDRTYSADGETQVALMVGGMAYAMKYAIRISSLDAYKKIFTDIRGDLTTAMASAKTN